MFRVNSRTGSGFFIEFANGRGVSVQWGPGTSSGGGESEGRYLVSGSAEVVVTPSGEPMLFRTPEEVAETIYRVSCMGRTDEKDSKGSAGG